MEGDSSNGLFAACGRDRKGHSPIEVYKVIPIVYLGLIVDQRTLRFRDLARPSGILGEGCARWRKTVEKLR
jgi:hypothetical protein